jgi:hypothetical protein
MMSLDQLLERAKTLAASDNANAAQQAVAELPSATLALLHRKLLERGWESAGPADATPHDTNAPLQWRDALSSWVVHTLNGHGAQHIGRAESGPDAEQGTLL